MNTPAYMEGFLDGYKEGVENNPYEHDDKRHQEYRTGYEAGVTYYVNEEQI
jgi:hypothetical protein